jgi:hypothetical protein
MFYKGIKEFNLRSLKTCKKECIIIFKKIAYERKQKRGTRVKKSIGI